MFARFLKYDIIFVIEFFIYDYKITAGKLLSSGNE